VITDVNAPGPIGHRRNSQSASDPDGPGRKKEKRGQSTNLDKSAIFVFL
jgi:hypothetical protein